MIRGSDGTQARVRVKGGGLDYLPRIEVDGHHVSLGRPLSKVEYVVGGIPLLLMFLGGAIGGMSGAVGAVCNYRILRTTASVPMKALGLLGVTGLTFLTYLLLAALIQVLIGGGAAA